jgi:drug/metabolite transporter (DMT)-like permease
MVASAACLIHCLLVPVIIAWLPTVAHVSPENEWIHVVLAVAAIPVAAIALTRGYRQHGSRMPGCFVLPGLTLLWLSLWIHDPHWLEAAVASLGAACLGIGHLMNHRLSCRCREGC